MTVSTNITRFVLSINLVNYTITSSNFSTNGTFFNLNLTGLLSETVYEFFLYPVLPTVPSNAVVVSNLSWDSTALRSGRAVPNVVANLTLSSPDSHVIRLRWRPPVESRGYVRQYRVTRTPAAGGPNETVQIFDRSEDVTYAFRGLAVYSLHTITVEASHTPDYIADPIYGRGVSQSIFTQPGAPIFPPENVTVTNITSKSAVISWLYPPSRISGPSKYNIIVLGETVQATFSVLQPPFVLADLSPFSFYQIQVRV